MSEIPKDVIVKAAAAYNATLDRWHSPEADARLGPMDNALLAVLPDLQQPQPGEPHEIDKAFYDLTVKERDFERQRADRLAAKCEQLTQEALDERAAFKAMLEKFKTEGPALQRELADSILERDAMREANAAGDADGLPLAQTVGYWQDKALDYATAADRLRAKWKQVKAERDARPELTPEERAVIIQDLDYSIEQWADNHDGYDGLRGLSARESARAKLEALR